jgi:hypothetical protein
MLTRCLVMRSSTLVYKSPGVGAAELPVHIVLPSWAGRGTEEEKCILASSLSLRATASRKAASLHRSRVTITLRSILYARLPTAHALRGVVHVRRISYEHPGVLQCATRGVGGW